MRYKAGHEREVLREQHCDPVRQGPHRGLGRGQATQERLGAEHYTSISRKISRKIPKQYYFYISRNIIIENRHHGTLL